MKYLRGNRRYTDQENLGDPGYARSKVKHKQTFLLQEKFLHHTLYKARAQKVSVRNVRPEYTIILRYGQCILLSYFNAWDIYNNQALRRLP